MPTVLIDLSAATHLSMSRDSALYHSIALAMLSLTPLSSSTDMLAKREPIDLYDHADGAH